MLKNCAHYASVFSNFSVNSTSTRLYDINYYYLVKSHFQKSISFIDRTLKITTIPNQGGPKNIGFGVVLYCQRP